MRTLLAIAAISTAAAASAQTIETPVNLAFRIGYAYPIDSDLRDATRNLIGVGADYFFQRSLVAGGETSISLDWLGKSGSGAKGNLFPLMLNQRWYQPGADEYANRSYFFLGAGVTFIDVDNTGTALAARAGLGVELSEHLFAEGTLFFSDHAGGARGNAAGIYIGYRF